MSDALLMILIFASPILLMMIFGKVGEISDKAKENRQIDQEKSNYRRGLFDSVGELHDGIAIAKIGNKYTYVRQIENPVGTRQWEIIGEDNLHMYGTDYLLYVQAENFSYGTGIAKKENGRFVLVDKRGYEHCESKFISVVGPNLVVVKIDESDYSLVSKSSGTTIAVGYESIGQFNDGRSIVEKQRLKTVIDTQGHQLFPFFREILLSTDNAIVFTNESLVSGWTPDNRCANVLGVYDRIQQKITIECEWALVFYDPATCIWICGQRLSPYYKRYYDGMHYLYSWKAFDAEYNCIIDDAHDIQILNNQYLVTVGDRVRDLGLRGLDGKDLLPNRYKYIYCSATGDFVAAISSSAGCSYDQISLFKRDKSGLKEIPGSYLLPTKSLLGGGVYGKQSRESGFLFYEKNSNKSICIYEDRSHLNMPSTEWAEKSELVERDNYCPTRLTVCLPGSNDRNEKKGILSISEGRLLIPCIYDYIEDWGEGLRLVKNEKSFWLNGDKIDSFSEQFLETFEHKAKEHRYLFFDTETTGLPRSQSASTKDSNAWPHIVQLSWILSDKEGHIISCALPPKIEHLIAIEN